MALRALRRSPVTPPCPYRQADNQCVEPKGHLGAHTLAVVDDAPLLDPPPPLRWCQHCGDDIGGQGRRVCAMCAADIAEREEHRGE